MPGSRSEKKQTTLDSLKPMTSMASTSKRAVAITEAIARFVAKDLHPIATVEGKGFRGLLSVVDPLYQIPSRKTFPG